MSIERLSETRAADESGALAGGGALVGPYRLERSLGRGGMGLVFLAHRADQQYEKRVAIKLLSGVSREQTLLRFRAERQILARLEHPHIARMLDGGVSQDGEPYFVMDYVPGAEAIDDYCDHHKLSLRARIELFLDVCDAVQYAHRFLVVHRDLKPSNVQVSRDGKAKLVDFGIAKDLLSAIGEEAASGAAPVLPGDTATHAGRTMTPGYASPEQVRGEAIGTASDVYALGVLLYELLTGSTPYLSASTDLESLLKEVCQGNVVKPSQCWARRGKPAPQAILASRGLKSQGRLERLLEGDLDAIVVKAMANSTQQRYASVDQLSDDLRRYLTGGLVKAAQHSASYRLKKLLARHRALSSAVATVLFGSLFFSGLTGSIALKERLDLIEARTEGAHSKELARFLTGIYHSAPAGTPATEVLRAAANRLGRHAAGEPGWYEAARLALAEAMVDAGAHADAIPLLENAVTQNEKDFSAMNADRVHAMALLGEAYLGQSRPREAAVWYRRALDGRQQLTGPVPNVPAPEALEARMAAALRQSTAQ